MDVATLVTFLQGLVVKFPIIGTVLIILGGLVVVGQVVITLTPGTQDDEAWSKIKAIPILGSIIDAIAQFAPIHKQ